MRSGCPGIMNIANIPVASPFHITPLEPKQRVAEFKLLDTALRAGNITEALKVVGLLQLNAPNSLLSVQKLRQFGYDNFEAQDLDILAKALKGGDLPTAQSAFISFKSRVESQIVHRRPEDEEDSPSPQDQQPQNQQEDHPSDTSNDEESPLDLLA